MRDTVERRIYATLTLAGLLLIYDHFSNGNCFYSLAFSRIIRTALEKFVVPVGCKFRCPIILLANSEKICDQFQRV